MGLLRADAHRSPFRESLAEVAVSSAALSLALASFSSSRNCASCTNIQSSVSANACLDSPREALRNRSHGAFPHLFLMFPFHAISVCSLFI